MATSSNNKEHTFRLLRCDSLRLAVAEDQVANVVDWTEPEALPFSPGSVLGIVCIQGRMFTVLDLAKLLKTKGERAGKRAIVALKGDEQLALAVAFANEIVEVASSSIEPPDRAVPSLIAGYLDHQSEVYQVLKLEELFPSILQGRERRRRRF